MGGRWGKRIPSGLSPVPRSQSQPNIKNPTLNQLSHPGAPEHSYFNIYSQPFFFLYNFFFFFTTTNPLFNLAPLAHFVDNSSSFSIADDTDFCLESFTTWELWGVFFFPSIIYLKDLLTEGHILAQTYCNLSYGQRPGNQLAMIYSAANSYGRRERELWLEFSKQ